MKRAAYLFSIILALTLCASTASARLDLSASGDPCEVENVRTDVRPDPDGPPTPIDMGVRLVDLRGISDREQTMTVDLGVILKWKDPRLAKLDGCEVPLDDIWSPGVMVLNSGRLITSRPREAKVGPGGTVFYLQRYFGSIATYHSLHKFPFDKQDFVISFASVKYGEDEVKLIVSDKFTGRTKRLNISDWRVGQVRAEVESMFSPAFERQHSFYKLHIPAQRITGYYLWKVLLPLILIVMMSWAVFWIDPARFGPQLGLSATSMLTLIAFLFATSTMLPELGYFTTLDIFIVGSTILVFLALVEALTTSFLVSKDRGKLARSMDSVCRVLFPLSFIAFVVIVILYTRAGNG